MLSHDAHMHVVVVVFVDPEYPQSLWEGRVRMRKDMVELGNFPTYIYLHTFPFLTWAVGCVQQRLHPGWKRNPLVLLGMLATHNSWK